MNFDTYTKHVIKEAKEPQPIDEILHIVKVLNEADDPQSPIDNILNAVKDAGFGLGTGIAPNGGWNKPFNSKNVYTLDPLATNPEEVIQKFLTSTGINPGYRVQPDYFDPNTLLPLPSTAGVTSSGNSRDYDADWNTTVALAITTALRKKSPLTISEIADNISHGALTDDSELNDKAFEYYFNSLGNNCSLLVSSCDKDDIKQKWDSNIVLDTNGKVWYTEKAAKMIPTVSPQPKSDQIDNEQVHIIKMPWLKKAKKDLAAHSMSQLNLPKLQALHQHIQQVFAKGGLKYYTPQEYQRHAGGRWKAFTNTIKKFSDSGTKFIRQ